MMSSTQTPIAIVGLACRLPGNSNTPEEFWQFLLDGGVADTHPPTSRFSLNGHYDGTQRPWTMRSPGGMFINADPQDVDAAFFGLSHVDAVSMDPQQRQLLEVVYEGLENAGLSMETIRSKAFGCFVGSYASGMYFTPRRLY
jgi:acyl transferase domain-containing protein